MNTSRLPLPALWLTVTLITGFLLPAAGSVSAQENKEQIRREIERELENVGKDLVDKIVNLVEKNYRDAMKKQSDRIAQLEKTLQARDLEVASLKEKVDALAKGIKEPAPKVEAKPAEPTKAFLGIGHIEPEEGLRAKLNLKEGEGAQVTAVLPGSPAQKAGLQEGDIILAVGDMKVGSENLSAVIRSHPPGKTIALSILRGAEKLSRNAELVDRDAFAARVPAVPVQPPAEKPEPTKARAQVVLGILVDEAEDGLVIQNVEKGLTGEAARLQEGDRLLAINGKKLSKLEDIRDSLAKIFAGDEMTIEVARKDQTIISRVIAGREQGQAKLLKSEPGKAVAEPAPKPAEKPQPPAAKKPATLGIRVAEEDGKVEIIEVIPGSVADAGGLKTKDLVREIDKSPVKTIDDIKKALEGKSAGDKIDLVVERGTERVAIKDLSLGPRDDKVAAPAPASAPKPPEKPKEPEKPRVKGIVGIAAVEDEEGKVVISEITAGGPGAQAMLQVDDVILKVRDVAVKTLDDVARALDGTFAGDAISFTVRRGGKEMEFKVTLGSAG